MSEGENDNTDSGIAGNDLQLEIIDAMVRLDYIVHSDATIAEEIGVERTIVIDEMKVMDEDGRIILAGNTGIAGRWILPRHRDHPEAQSFFDDDENESPRECRRKQSKSSNIENSPDTSSENGFNNSQFNISAWEEGVWTYYITPEGQATWINMESGKTSNRKVRPGDAPEEGDGYGDYLSGWTEPVQTKGALLAGQLLEVKVKDRDPEVAIVLQNHGETVIRTEKPNHFSLGRNSISVLAVEEELASRDVHVPSWAKPYRPTEGSDT